MDFASEYKIYSKIKLDCILGPDIRIEKIMHGSGGSQNIIIKAKLKSVNMPLIIKIFPRDAYHNTKRIPNFNELEIKFYQFFTQKYLLMNRTPHIVGIYSHKHCLNIDFFIKKKLLNKPCPTYADQLTKRNLKQSESDNYLCDILLRKEMKLITADYDMCLIEYCETDMDAFLREYLTQIKKFKSVKYISRMVYRLHIIIFQIIFTLGIIKSDYPGFLHGDFFSRNILLRDISSFSESDCVAYHYKNKIFYLPANGPSVKINDFGMTVIANKIEPNVFDPRSDPRLAFNSYNYDPFSEKTDLYNFFIDMYRIILYLGEEFDIPKDKIGPIVETLDNFFDTKAIDKIPNKELLYDIWHINNIKVLTSTLKTPVEYLTGNYFKLFEQLDPNSAIIKHYNLS